MIYCAFIEQNKDTVRHVVNNQARIIRKLFIEKEFYFLGTCKCFLFCMETRKFFGDKLNHPQVKRKKVRTSCLTRIMFLGIIVYLENYYPMIH